MLNDYAYKINNLVVPVKQNYDFDYISGVWQGGGHDFPDHPPPPPPPGSATSLH